MHKVTLERVKFGTMHGLIAEYEGKGAECRVKNDEVFRLAQAIYDCPLIGHEVISGVTQNGAGIVVINLGVELTDDCDTVIGHFDNKIDAEIAAEFLQKLSNFISECAVANGAEAVAKGEMPAHSS